MRIGGAAQRREGRGDEGGRISGVTIDKSRRKCGLKDGLLFGDQVGVYGQGFGLRIESRERALFAGQTQADGAFSNRDAKNRDLNSLQLRSLCTSTHPVSSCCVLSLGTRFCHDVVVLEQCFVVDTACQRDLARRSCSEAHVFVPIRPARCFRPKLTLHTPQSRSCNITTSLQYRVDTTLSGTD